MKRVRKYEEMTKGFFFVFCFFFFLGRRRNKIIDVLVLFHFFVLNWHVKLLLEGKKCLISATTWLKINIELQDHTYTFATNKYTKFKYIYKVLNQYNGVKCNSLISGFHKQLFYFQKLKMILTYIIQKMDGIIKVYFFSTF
jgi:hypothetical protein